MSQAGSSGRRVQNVAEEQLLLSELGPPRNGVTITPSRAAAAAKRGGADFEKQPFLSSEPVRLTPAWEETNLPNDELNFKGVTMEQAQLEMNPPCDRWNLVYLTLLLHGIGTLMPWNMFITAKDYFVSYKLHQDYTGVVANQYAANFLFYIAFASQVPNLIFNWLNIFVQLGGNLTTRIVWSIFVEVLLFVFTVILAMSDSSSWPGVFFWITMISVVVINMANGIYQNTVYGMAAKLPFKYTGAVILGSNISGTFTALISMASQFVAPNTRTAAIYYFITALFVLLACFDTYFALPLNRFYRYHELLSQKEAQDKKIGDNSGVAPKIPYGKIFRQCLPQCFNVFMVFFVTLTLFPAVHSDIKRSSNDFVISEKLYTTVTCFLTFNVSAMIGSCLPALGTWPKPKLLVIPVMLRILFIPLFLVFNYQPLDVTRALPVYIDNDWIYWGSAIAMGVTSGYFSSVAMMYCPRTVEPQYASTAGMFGAASLITGIFGGVLFSFTMPLIVKYIKL